ncbi:GNAT family N-acetyltransferase [Aquimarina sp. M1]
MYWIVFDADTAVGYAKIQLNDRSEFIKAKKVCKLQKIYILKQHLGKSIGTQLQ